MKIQIQKQRRKGGGKVESYLPPIPILESSVQPVDADDQRGTDNEVETQPQIISEAAEEDLEEVE